MIEKNCGKGFGLVLLKILAVIYQLSVYPMSIVFQVWCALWECLVKCFPTWTLMGTPLTKYFLAKWAGNLDFYLWLLMYVSLITFLQVLQQRNLFHVSLLNLFLFLKFFSGHGLFILEHSLYLMRWSRILGKENWISSLSL
jgi:hypothetical protein